MATVTKRIGLVDQNNKSAAELVQEVDDTNAKIRKTEVRLKNSSGTIIGSVALSTTDDTKSTAEITATDVKLTSTNINATATGTASVTATGATTVKGSSVNIEATGTDTTIKAKSNVILDGPSVKRNTDVPTTDTADHELIDFKFAKAKFTQSDGVTIWIGTQAEYDAITTKSTSTLYFIKEES